jgi:dihydroorotate dehydrogenase electron transfer subunit
VRLVGAELIEAREILPGQWLQTYHAPALATGSRAGQFVHVRTGDLSGFVLRRPFSINTVDVATGTISIHFRTIGRGTEWFTHLRPGDTIDMLGPLGRPFEVDPRSQHLLLIAGGLGMAGVRSLADEAVRDGRQVTLLFGAASARDVYPTSLLPDEVEYVIATDDGSVGHHGYVTDLVLSRCCRPSRASPRRGTTAWAWRNSAASVAAERRSPPARRTRGAGHSSRSPWSSAWAVRSGPASAAW